MSVLTRDNIAHELGPANASATAQQSGSGIGIQNIRRGVGEATIGGVADMTVSATSWAALDPVLELEMWLVGRPIRVRLEAMVQAGSSANVTLDVLMRGVSISGATNGMLHSNATAALTLSAERTVMTPAPGRAKFQVVARRANANGTIHLDNEQAVLSVVEL